MRLALPLIVCILSGVQAGEIPALSLPGTMLSVTWSDLSATAHPRFLDDTKPWPTSITGAPASAGLALWKLRGSGYATRSGIYSGNAGYHGPLAASIMSGQITEEDLPLLKAEDFSNPGIFQITASSVLPSIRTVVLQISIQGLSKGRHFSPFALTQKVFPATLSYNGGEQKLPAVVEKMLAPSMQEGMPGEIYALQWDLSSVAETITSFTLTWTVYPHSCTSGIQVSQGTIFQEIKAGGTP